MMNYDIYSHNSSPTSSVEPNENVDVFYNLTQPVTSFTGRLTELNELKEALQCDHQDQQLLQSSAAVIIGLGGAGKTELARKYASNHSKFYKHILWIDAEKSESIKSAFQQVASQYLGITSTGQDCDVNITISKVYSRLSSSKSLFVFDNAEGYAVIKPFLPTLLKQNMGNIHILFTSRVRDWDVADEGNISEIHLKEFLQAEAEEFIQKTLNDKEINMIDITHLAKELAYFPLALKQAIAYINQRDHHNKRVKKKFDIGDFLAEFRLQSKDLLDHTGYSGYNRYNKTIFTVLSLTLDNLSTELNGKAALEALRIVAYLAPDHIEIAMFEAFDGAVVLLEKYAILTIQKGTACVHRLVQQVTRLQSENNEKNCLRTAISTVNNNPQIVYQTFHAMFIWSYAIKHYDLIEEFYFSPNSTYGKHREHTPLHLFIIFQNYEAAEALLEMVNSNGSMKSEMLNSVDKLHCTPLRTALLSGGSKFVQLLCEHGASFDGMVHDSLQLLDVALRYRNWDLLTLFLKNIINVNAIDDDGATILVAATCDNRPHIIKLLIEKGGNINAVYEDTDDPLHNAIDENDLEYLKTQIENGADVNATRDRGMTLLHIAVYKNNFEIAKLLIETGANVNAIHNLDETLLHHAITSNNFEIVKFLIENGADINTTSNRNSTLLHCAIIRNYSDIAELLIKNGADVHAIYDAGEPILHYAISQNKMDIAKMLAEKGADVNYMYYCDEERAYYRPHRGRSPLYYAYLTENMTIANLLIQRGADVNTARNDFDGQMAMAGLLFHDLKKRDSGIMSMLCRMCYGCYLCFRCNRSASLTDDFDEAVHDAGDDTDEFLDSMINKLRGHKHRDGVHLTFNF